MTEQSTETVKYGSVDWAKDEPEWIGPSCESEEYFVTLTSLVRMIWGGGYGGTPEQAALMAQWAWEHLVESVEWVYETDYYEPEAFGLPSYEQWVAQAGTLEERVKWALENQSNDLRQLYFLEKEETHRQARLAEARKKVNG